VKNSKTENTDFSVYKRKSGVTWCWSLKNVEMEGFKNSSLQHSIFILTHVLDIFHHDISDERRQNM
jgi:hypothetical protein